ncbi:MAG: lysine--tRNA ligase [Candidatus Lokiarchaeota archaeon]|nr:lysine--tRNA ligase [Candidatus Lokiarchaeota archaeon]
MTEKSKIQPQHWIDTLTSDLIDNWQGLKEFNCNCGISISGQQHVGRLRGEIILTNAVITELQVRGYETIHYLILYTSDPWKGKSAQLDVFSDPEKAKKYINWRLIDVPSPFNQTELWVDYFWKDFGEPMPRFGKDIQIIRTHELYQQQRMKKVVIELINKKDNVREILNKFRKENPFPENWIPINPLCEQCNRIGTTKALDINLNTYQVHYFCEECKNDGWSDISKGKLTWRLEWLAIWYVLNIHFEPYGKDHATPGGSRDSCIEVLESVLNHRGPYGFWNEWVGYSVGKKDFGDMTSSGFIGFTPTKWLEYAEPEVLKYMYLKTPPKRRIILGLDKIPSYIAEYDRAQRIYHGLESFADSTELYVIQRSYEIVFYNKIPEYRGFQLDYQTAVILSQLVTPDQKGTKQAIQKLLATEILKKSPSKEVSEHIQIRLIQARNWVNSKYSPTHLRIKLNEHFSPDIIEQYNEKIHKLVLDLGQELEGIKWTEEEIKQKMITLREETEISRKEMNQFFQLLYKIFLGNTRGPRFAPFIAALDKKWVISRFQEIQNL